MNDGDLNEDRFSICVACTNHPRLAQFIQANGEPTRQCSLCLETKHPCCSSENTPNLINVFKALVRIFYDEEEYNRHWGGHDSPVSLFEDATEIINLKRFKQPTDNLESGFDLLDHEFSDEPYPDIDKGIGIYAGYSDGQQNTLLRAIQTSQAHELTLLRRNLQKTNAAELEAAFDQQLDLLITPCSAEVEAGTTFFRARIGYDRIEHKHDLTMTPVPIYVPYAEGQLGAPPPPLASAGRLNRQGVSYLYVGSSDDTAISEIRPHPGHHISVGQFTTDRALKVLDFSRPTFLDFQLTDVGLDQFELTQSIDRDLSRPITPEHRSSYVSAQFIAELIRRRGFDGVQYRSSVSKGTNLCIFDPGLARFVADSAAVFRTKSVIYEHERVAPHT